MTGSNEVNRSGRKYISDWKEQLRPANTSLTIATVRPHPTNLVKEYSWQPQTSGAYRDMGNLPHDTLVSTKSLNR